MKAQNIPMPKRLLIYFLGMITVSLGIVLCKKCGMGISPISSIPLVLEYITHMSFGTLTMLFHLANTGLQILLARKIDVKIVLQVPVAVLFGWIINALQMLLQFETSFLPAQLLLLLLSVFLTALGMVFMLNMQLVQNPPDGTVRLISQLAGQELGRIKIIYDVSCVILSLVLSLICLRNLTGFGFATIVSALAVGKLVSWMNPYFISIFGDH